MVKDKKGAEMTIGTIIVIILALVVLVILVYGFSTGWTNLWDKIANFGGGKVNVQTVVQSCQLACTTQSTYDYCTKTRSIIFNIDKATEEKKVAWTCNSLQKGKGSEVGLEPCDLGCVSVEKTSEEIATAEAAANSAKCNAITTNTNGECANAGCSWSGVAPNEKCEAI